MDCCHGPPMFAGGAGASCACCTPPLHTRRNFVQRHLGVSVIARAVTGFAVVNFGVHFACLAFWLSEPICMMDMTPTAL